MGASGLPVVDEVLAGALEAQGELGVRALGMLQDAHRALTGAGFTRPAEVAAACVRSAADALLGLPGAPVTAGLKPAAKDLPAAVDAVGERAVGDSPPGEPPAAPARTGQPAAVGACDTVGSGTPAVGWCLIGGSLCVGLRGLSGDRMCREVIDAVVRVRGV
ncbi:hypothetical protein [Streptomyces sp. NPDC001833]|uniref:hypothetical protein n=1 Tax=Streptomyces sp. NPDC001833 TaxID=3154658 RepID=UPI0033177944